MIVSGFFTSGLSPEIPLYSPVLYKGSLPSRKLGHRVHSNPLMSMDPKHLIAASDYPRLTPRPTFLSAALATILLLITTNTFADDSSPDLTGAGETVLLVGASGAIGQYVTQLLQSRGCKVRGLTRYPDKARKELGVTVEWVGGDLRRPEILQDDAYFRRLVSGADRVHSQHRTSCK